jgi:hypothetical protein
MLIEITKGAKMWVAAVSIFISLVLFLLGRIAKTRRMSSVFFWSGIAVCSVAAFLTSDNEYSCYAIMGFVPVSGPISDVIAIPIVRRRVMPPCVRAEKCQNRILMIAGLLSVIAFFVFLLVTESYRSLKMMLLLGPCAVVMIMGLILELFGKTEICGNGLWQYCELQPWEDFKFFSWKWNRDDSVDLRLVSKSWICPSTRLMVRPEDREAVQQLLEENLPDLSPVRMTSW